MREGRGGPVPGGVLDTVGRRRRSRALAKPGTRGAVSGSGLGGAWDTEEPGTQGAVSGSGVARDMWEESVPGWGRGSLAWARGRSFAQAEPGIGEWGGPGRGRSLGGGGAGEWARAEPGIRGAVSGSGVARDIWERGGPGRVRGCEGVGLGGAWDTGGGSRLKRCPGYVGRRRSRAGAGDP
ncbi:myosin heavy chain IB-like [Capsicum annuum]|uniref:myosin heavy chain IB-like n=1 Tax=Capsicum annuum TaxID=4072 RepID=UPI001FB13E03|nr:myosin heavy chain IB-like [Capsicum annuum]